LFEQKYIEVQDCERANKQTGANNSVKEGKVLVNGRAEISVSKKTIPNPDAQKKIPVL